MYDHQRYEETLQGYRKLWNGMSPFHCAAFDGWDHLCGLRRKWELESKHLSI